METFVATLAGSGRPAVGDEGRALREIARAIVRYLNLPATSLTTEDFGPPLSLMLGRDMPAAGALTQEFLGWTPTHSGLIEDIEKGHYFI